MFVIDVFCILVSDYCYYCCCCCGLFFFSSNNVVVDLVMVSVEGVDVNFDYVFV